jgi:hypothetical protein
MHARPARPRRTKGVTLKLTQAEFAALQRAAQKEDLGPFCRQIVIKHLNFRPDPLQWLQLRHQVSTREILKRVLSLPAVDKTKIEKIESDVRYIEEALTQAEFYRFRQESDDREQERITNGLNSTSGTTNDEITKYAGPKNELKCVAIVKKLAELAKENHSKIVGLKRNRGQGELHIGSAYTELSLPDDPGYKTWCFFVDDFYNAIHGDPQFYWQKVP